MFKYKQSNCDSKEESGSGETVPGAVAHLVELFRRIPLVMVVDCLVHGVGSRGVETVALGSMRHVRPNLRRLEIIVLLLVEVAQFPENTNVLKLDIVPFVVVWVVWDSIVVETFAFSPHSNNFCEFVRVNVSYSSSFVF